MVVRAVAVRAVGAMAVVQAVAKEVAAREVEQVAWKEAVAGSEARVAVVEAMAVSLAEKPEGGETVARVASMAAPAAMAAVVWAAARGVPEATAALVALPEVGMVAWRCNPRRRATRAGRHRRAGS